MPIDYKKYPPNWKSEIVPRILERANNCCEVCGLANKSMVYSGKIWVRSNERKYKHKTIWITNHSDLVRFKDIVKKFTVKRVVLTIAHLDHNETNWQINDNRLKAMCQYCHLNYDAKEKYRRATGGHICTEIKNN